LCGPLQHKRDDDIRRRRLFLYIYSPILCQRIYISVQRDIVHKSHQKGMARERDQVYTHRPIVAKGNQETLHKERGERNYMNQTKC
jgi:hypothetical protein